MKTADLITALTADISPVDTARTDRRFFSKLAAGTLLAVLITTLVMGTRPDVTVTPSAMFWMKLLLPASLAVCALLALHRLSYPGVRLGHVLAAAALPLTMVWLMAGLALVTAPAGERLPLVLGKTWIQCSLSIALLSVPVMALAIWAARELAPTRLSLTGAAGGLFAGAVAALAYALYCPETQAPFLAVWYVLGMLIPTIAGATFGRRMLHW